MHAHFGSVTFDYESRKKIEEAIAKTKKLYKKKGDFLAYLKSVDEKTLNKVCLKTAKEFPDISIAVILNDNLCPKISDTQAKRIIKKNKYIALKLGQSPAKFLKKLGGWTLEVICKMTINENPDIALRIFSNKKLRNEIFILDQKLIIQNSFILAKALYDKGLNFVNTLSKECIIGICLATAEQRPDISVDIITNYAYMLGVDEYDEILDKNPVIERLLATQNSNNNKVNSHTPLNDSNINNSPYTNNNNNSALIPYQRQNRTIVSYVPEISSISDTMRFLAFQEQQRIRNCYLLLVLLIQTAAGIMYQDDTNNNNVDHDNSENNNNQSREVVLYRPNIYTETMRFFAAQNTNLGSNNNIANNNNEPSNEGSCLVM